MGDYGVEQILGDEELRKSFRAVVLAANDPVGVWGGILKLERDHGLAVTVVTGPATDNAAGTDVIRGRMGTAAFNARTHPGELAELLVARLGLGARTEAQGGA
jgi:hypothetical protein